MNPSALREDIKERLVKVTKTLDRTFLDGENLYYETCGELATELSILIKDIDNFMAHVEALLGELNTRMGLQTGRTGG